MTGCVEKTQLRRSTVGVKLDCAIAAPLDRAGRIEARGIGAGAGPPFDRMMRSATCTRLFS